MGHGAPWVSMPSGRRGSDARVAGVRLVRQQLDREAYTITAWPCEAWFVKNMGSRASHVVSAVLSCSPSDT